MSSSSVAASRNTDIKVVIVGHVDHGKSTLVGRLLHDTGSLPDGKAEAVAEICRQRGVEFEWAFVTDALKSERDQGITIDSGHIRLKSGGRNYFLVDAPGHREFIRNMISGAADCDAALVVIDATEGVKEQSRRHAYMLSLLGVRQVAVAVTKMDAVGFDLARFADVSAEVTKAFGGLGIDSSIIIPVSGRGGENVMARSTDLPWYDGPTLMETLEAFQPTAHPVDIPLRIPVQDVYRFDERRIIAGRIESGRIRVGDTIMISPSNKKVKVKSLEAWSVPEPVVEACAGQPVGITLEEQVFVQRGEVISHVVKPPIETDIFRARLFWLNETALTEGQRLKLIVGTHEGQVEVQQIERIIDPATLSDIDGDGVPCDCVADVILRVQGMLAIDRADDLARTGRFALADRIGVVGGGLISMEGYPDQREALTQRSDNIYLTEKRVTNVMRYARNGHPGGVLWFTGLSGSGKSTLAVEMERRLFDAGYQVIVLDGDNLRHGLNANLGFSPEDRAENIRRAGEVAALFAQAGFIVITAFISPYRADRDRAREATGLLTFQEIYIEAGLEVCEARDPKGLYRKARSGEIAEFTGLTAPYEIPEAPDLVIDTAAANIEQCLDTLIEYSVTRFPLGRSAIKEVVGQRG